MGKQWCLGRKEHDPTVLIERSYRENNYSSVEHQAKSKSSGERYEPSVTKIQLSWKKYKLRMLSKFNLFSKKLDKRMMKVGKYITEELFNSKLNETVLLIYNNKSFNDLKNITPVRKLHQKLDYIEKGPVELHTGIFYKGEWNTNLKRNGYGVLIHTDGSRFEGFWENDNIHGFGRYIYVNGDIYEGYWAKSKAEGKGTLLKLNGTNYNGDWKEDFQDGFGEEIFEGGKYVGEFSKGMKCGKGKLYFSNETYYEGEFSNNTFNGRGEIKWNVGDTYKGEWINSKMDGFGIFRWRDGRKYIGEYREDKKDGFGVYYWSDNKYYSGFWKNGKREGPAKLHKKKQTKYYVFKNDVIDKEIDEFNYKAMVEYMKGLRESTNLNKIIRRISSIEMLEKEENSLKNGI
jgi:hypothetical protein